jgi:hypothetical protein
MAGMWVFGTILGAIDVAARSELVEGWWW